MIFPFRPCNLTQILILTQLILLLILLQSPAIHSDLDTMKVHPVPRKRNITVQYDMNARNPLSEAQELLGLSNKKLRRLPHVFSRVLELPFRSDADVSIEEGPDYFRFKAETDGIGDVQAHTVEIHPGVIKIMVRESGSVEFSLDEIELDMWRFRLPESTRPELASAVLVDGELIVTVPKGEELDNPEDGNGNGGGEMWGDGNGMGGRLVLVQ
ncbi:uncharacterized protein LOC114730594 [Neltuma alba]|uniref:uncharacterized protein LOC114730594 n=1 Tax=Neltuma alba TaxID=207710 RepID=UPI0010A4A406|nr:uncharacterized protein LOC114730594 [Prosopis alba]